MYLQFLAVAREHRAQAKVDELDVLPSVQQHVLQLDVPVHDAVLVAVFQRAAQLVEEPGGFLLRQFLTSSNVVEKRPAVCILHDDVHDLRRVHDVEQPDDVLVRQSLEHANLASHPPLIVLRRQLILVHEFHRRLGARHLVDAQTNFTEPALADDLAEVIPRELASLVDGPDVHHGPRHGGVRPDASPSGRSVRR